MKGIVNFMVVKHIRVDAGSKKRLLKLIEEQRQERVEFIIIVTVLAIVVLAAVVGLLSI